MCSLGNCWVDWTAVAEVGGRYEKQTSLLSFWSRKIKFFVRSFLSWKKSGRF